MCSRPTPAEEMLAVAAEAPHGAIVLHARRWDAAELSGAAIAVGDCADDDEAAAFAAAARAAGVPVNVIDKPAFCDFSFGAIVNRSPLVIGISTDGAAPVFGQAIRAKLEALIPKGFARWAEARAKLALARAVAWAAVPRPADVLGAIHGARRCHSGSCAGRRRLGCAADAGARRRMADRSCLSAPVPAIRNC